MASTGDINVKISEVSATKSPRRSHSPNTKRGSPSIVTSQIVTRSKLALQTNAATENTAIGDQKIVKP